MGMVTRVMRGGGGGRFVCPEAFPIGLIGLGLGLGLGHDNGGVGGDRPSEEGGQVRIKDEVD